MYTVSFVRWFSFPNRPEVEERGQVLSIVYFFDIFTVNFVVFLNVL